MIKEDKAKIIGELVEDFKTFPYFYITDNGGLSVAQTNQFRRLCFEKGVKYKVVKNTLIKKALEQLDTDYENFSTEVLKGFSGIIFSPESGNLPAKLIKEFRKKATSAKPILKGASIDTDLFIGDNQLEVLISLKSKSELIADVIFMLQSPAKNVVSALMSGQNKLAGIVKTLSERE